jgi:hypothetical protein
MKKKLSALLAVSLATLSAFPVGAASNASSTQITATTAVPDITIDVTVPSQTNAYLNPNQVTVSLGNKMEYGQILSPNTYITNNSVVPIAVSASVTGKISETSSMVLRDSTTVGANVTGKEAFVYFEMQPTADTDPDNITWDPGYDAQKHLLVLDGETTEKANLVTIDAASQAKHYGAFRLAGDCVENPAHAVWTSDDSFTATIVFTFKALPLGS